MNLNRPIWPTTRIESPVIPKRFKRGLTDFGGRNVHGEPNYQVAWAMDAEIFENGDPHARKYPNPRDISLGYACFWLERYATPEFFDQSIWNELRYAPCELGTGKMIDVLGPFPHRGRYIGAGPLIKDNADGEPWEMLPLTSAVLDEVKRNLDPGALKSTVLGRIETGRLVRKAKSASLCQQRLEEVRQYYRTNAEKINARHTGIYSGLDTFKPGASAIPESVRSYLDQSGAAHTLWEGKDGSGNAQIDFTI